jgi:hypothetical protein
MNVDPEHPIHDILFYVYDGLSDSVVAEMEKLVIQLAETRVWTISPPEFIDETEEPEDPSKDLPIRTVGGMFRTYSAWPPWRERLPVEIDRLHFEVFLAAVEAATIFSKHHNVEMAFELNGIDSGWIKDGVMDDLMKSTIDEWKKGLRA